MSLKKILQAKLLEKHYLSINDIKSIADEHGCYQDTLRNMLEPKKTPFAKKIFDSKKRIAGWSLIENTNQSPDSQISPKMPPRSVEKIQDRPTEIQPNLFNLKPLEAKRKKIYEYN